MDYKDFDIQLMEEQQVKYESVRSFKDLIVWQKSMELVRQIYLVTNDLPESEKFGISSQIRRASVSVPSNISEGWGRNSKGSYLNHLKISNGSLCETETQLLLIENLELIDETKLQESKKLIDECGRMLKSMINKIEESNKKLT